MPTAPPSSTAAPAQLPQRGIKATFNQLMDAWVTWFSTKAVVEVPALAANAFSNATEAAQSAVTASTAAITATSAAASAVATANATPWVSGQSVAQYESKISPLDRQTYRRKTTAGSGTTDPSLDTTNYDPLLPLKRMFASAEQAVTTSGTLTIAHGLGAVPKFVSASVRSISTGSVWFVSPASDSYGSGSTGADISADSTNLYIVYTGSSVVFPRAGSNTNSAFTVRAFL